MSVVLVHGKPETSPVWDPLLAVIQGSIYVLAPLPGFDRVPGSVAVAETLQQLWKASQATGGWGRPMRDATSRRHLESHDAVGLAGATT